MFVKFNGTKCTDYDLRLTKFDVSGPERKEIVVDIPGTDGVVDLSDAFGMPAYKNREIKMEFELIVPPTQMVEAIENFIWMSGLRTKIAFSEDPDREWEGVLNITGTNRNGSTCVVKMNAIVNPYRWANEEQENVTVSGTFETEYGIPAAKVRIKITSNATMTASFNNGAEWRVYRGENEYRFVELIDNMVSVRLKGNGTAKIEVFGGIL